MPKDPVELIDEKIAHFRAKKRNEKMREEEASVGGSAKPFHEGMREAFTETLAQLHDLKQKILQSDE